MKNGTKTALRPKTGFDGPSPDVGKATQFKRGNQGGGRPRTAKFAEAARQLAAEIGKDGRTGARKLAEYCFNQAMKGSARHMEIFLHYAEGKPQGAAAPIEAEKLENKSTAEIEEFREKLLNGELLEIAPQSKPN